MCHNNNTHCPRCGWPNELESAEKLSALTLTADIIGRNGEWVPISGMVDLVNIIEQHPFSITYDTLAKLTCRLGDCHDPGQSELDYYMTVAGRDCAATLRITAENGCVVGVKCLVVGAKTSGSPGVVGERAWMLRIFDCYYIAKPAKP